MDVQRLREILLRLEQGQVDVEAVLEELRELPYQDLEFARIDHHRALRQGIPEVVLAEGKTREQVGTIAQQIAERGHGVLVTRVPQEWASELIRAQPGLRHNPFARTLVQQGPVPAHRANARVAIVTAGTSDRPVAEEASETLLACGITPDRLEDVGVAGLHRLLPEVPRLRRAEILIVIAGMEGALASVLGGLVAAPVIAVPTSVGYGAAFGGVAALLGMLTSCAAGVTVVNIDNGFGAAVAAVRALDRFRAKPGEGSALVSPVE